MPANDITAWFPAILVLALLFGVALYLQSKGLHDPRILATKAPRLLGVVYLLLAGALPAILFACERQDLVDKGSFVVTDNLLVLPLALSILGVIHVALGPHARHLIPVAPDVRRITAIQWAFVVIFTMICLAALFGFPKLMEHFGWRVRRFP